jgi:3-oxoacyl-[acyl-carrier-protein] synthase II
MSRNDPAIACRPFDRDRDGFVMGEGGAAVVLEEYEQARARGAHIYAEIAGYSLNNDASHMTTPLESGAACTAAMTDAIQRAGISPQEIDYINGHASSTRLNDANEAFCIRKLFGKAARAIPVSGTKAYYGHPLGASAAIEAVICALAFEHNFLPPTLNLQNPDEDCELDLVWGEPRKRQANYILSNAFGFGGINSCVVFKRV